MTFAYDKITGSPYRPDKENERAKDEGGDIGFHNDNLFDQNESISGDLIDPGTGEKYDNSTYTGMELLGQVAIKDSKTADVLGRMPHSKADEAADKWMKENGFSWED